jgi:hypothetical protein
MSKTFSSACQKVVGIFGILGCTGLSPAVYGLRGTINAYVAQQSNLSQKQFRWNAFSFAFRKAVLSHASGVKTQCWSSFSVTIWHCAHL